MLSFYDALSFSTQKKSLFCGFLIAAFLLICFVFVGYSLEAKFSIFSSFKLWLIAPPQSMPAINSLYHIAQTLRSSLFWSVVFQKFLWITVLFWAFSFVFFAFELIIAKKMLFNQPAHFSFSFFVVSLGKFSLLWIPVILILYIYLYDLIKSTVGFCAALVIGGTSSVYKYPFSVAISIVLFSVVGFYLIYTISLFIERFSFKSLLNVKLFFKHLITVLELIFNIVLLKFLFLIGLCVLCAVCWKIDSLWVCFGFLMAYLVWMVVLDNARFIFILPFVLMGAGALIIQKTIGSAFFHQYLFIYMIGSLAFFMMFFFWFMLLSAMAHLFAQTAFVFRFNETPAKDIKKKSPNKLRRIDELYNAYLKEHHNDTQDNFFDHLEEKRK